MLGLVLDQLLKCEILDFLRISCVAEHLNRISNAQCRTFKLDLICLSGISNVRRWTPNVRCLSYEFFKKVGHFSPYVRAREAFISTLKFLPTYFWTPFALEPY
jgi:hypothetical protein